MKNKITNFDVIRHSMDCKLGLLEADPKKILENKWNQDFFTLAYFDMLERDYIPDYWLEFIGYMKRRLIFGEFRYGKDCPFQIAGFYRDYKKSAYERRQAYQADKNLEHLVDRANCLYIDWLATKDERAALSIIKTYGWYCHGRMVGHKVKTLHNKKEKDRIHSR